MAHPVFVTNEEVKSVLSWPLVNESVEEALKSVVNNKKTADDIPYASQNARTFTPTHNNTGVMLTMPGYVGNHKVSVNGMESKFETLACKVVTSVKNNESLYPPMPSILANILLLNSETGQLECVMDGTLITAWRTASASLVATKYLYSSRPTVPVEAGITIAIVGCGVQGRIHAMGLCSVFRVNEIRLWNRSIKKAEDLAEELQDSRQKFVNPNVMVNICETVKDCVANADIITTATYTQEPLLHLDMLKKDVHINAVGAGVQHYSELGQDIYDVASVYIDHWAGAKTELKGLQTNFVCELGEVIIESKYPQGGVTVFQSMGMAVEDATVAQAVYQTLRSK